MLRMGNGFVHWLTVELEGRDWSQRELGRQSGLSVATISMVLSEQRKPTPEFCIEIARALRLSPEEVLRRAGHLPPRPVAPSSELRRKVDRIAELLATLPANLQDRLADALIIQAEASKAAFEAAERQTDQVEE